ncbi:MAG: hypothetical protein ACQESG_02845 [Nanobdellota archaeon]
MDKGGTLDTDIMPIILDLLLIAALLVFLLGKVTDYENHTYFEKNYLAKDLALLIDTIYAAPVEVSYLYDPSGLDLSRYSFDFTDQQVQVRDDTMIYYPFAINSLTPLAADSLDNPLRVFIENTNVLRVAQDSGTATCSYALDTADPQWRSKLIALDPSDQIDWQGATVDKNIMWDIATQVKVYLGTNIQLTSRDFTAEKKPIPNADITIALAPGRAEPTIIPITISYDMADPRARKLSCLLQREFQEAGLGDAVNTVRLQRTGGAEFVRIELGNVLNSGSILEKKQEKIFTSITDAITQFYTG